jgi:hypothetical protein
MPAGTISHMREVADNVANHLADHPFLNFDALHIGKGRAGPNARVDIVGNGNGEADFVSLAQKADTRVAVHNCVAVDVQLETRRADPLIENFDGFTVHGPRV